MTSAARAKITPKPTKPKATTPNKPDAGKSAPAPKPPEIHVDTDAIAQAVNRLADMLGKTMDLVMHLEKEQHELMEKIDKQNSEIMKLANKTQPTPIVKIPARPREFTVDVEKESGDSVSMRIRAESTH